MASCQPSKLDMRVRFPSASPYQHTKGGTFMEAIMAFMVLLGMLVMRADDDAMDILRIEQEQERAPRRRRRAYVDHHA